jgi:DNA repair exonuclease SbcCD ATPase subunit
LKILYLKLINFSQIYTGMKRKEIQIDFTKNTNRIILLIGPNGSGKTAILSQLQPFAYPGALDIRNGIDIILDNQNGYKEIIIENNDDIYKICHHYKYSKNGYSIKSFILKNDIELNPNGNQTSFKEIIYLEFGIDVDFLKLLRLGSNVTNFIDMKSTDRKNFSKELLTDVDIYSQFYKKINDDVRSIRSISKSIIDKINKLNVSSKDEVKESIKSLTNDLNDYRKKRSLLESEIWEMQGYIKNVIPDQNFDKFLEKLKNKEKEQQSLEDEINKLVIKMRKYEYTGTSTDAVLSKISSNDSMVEYLKIEMNNLYKQKDEKENILKTVTSYINYTSIHDKLIELTKKKDSLSKYENFNLRYTKSDILSAISLMHNINSIISTIVSFDNKAVKEVVRLISNNINIEVFVKDKLKVIEYKIQETNLKKMDLEGNPSDYYIMAVPTECNNNNCTYYLRYNSEIENDEKVSIKSLINDLEKYEKKKEFYISLVDINKNIEYITLLIKSNKELIEKLPKNYFIFKEILKKINKLEEIYFEDELIKNLEIIDEFEDYNRINEQIKELKKELNFYKMNKTNIDTIQNDINTIDDAIIKASSKINEITKDNKTLEILYTQLKEYVQLHDRSEYIKEQMSDNYVLIGEMEDIKEKVEKYVIKHTDNINKLKELNDKLAVIEKEVLNKQFILMEFESLTKELKIYKDQISEIEILKESLSSTKGLPLLFVKLYMEDIKVHVNELLELIYKGDLEINDFIITEDEFNIPYTKLGMKISDVIKSSQGEKSFISLVISFALLVKGLDKYNIMLLDEIDSTLDTTNRYKFISILEKQLDVINAEQCFVITHNNMFDNYPISVIMTESTDIDNFKNVNIVKIN